jgi:hypothetical protein
MHDSRQFVTCPYRKLDPTGKMDRPSHNSKKQTARTSQPRTPPFPARRPNHRRGRLSMTLRNALSRSRGRPCRRQELRHRPSKSKRRQEPSRRTAPIEPMNTALVERHDALMSSHMPPRAIAKMAPLPVPRPAAVAKASRLRRLKRAAAQKSTGLLPQRTHRYGCRPVDMATR